MVIKGRLGQRESAAEQAPRWGRTIRPRLPFLPLLGERAGVRAELPSSLPSTSPTAGNGMTPVPIRLPLLGEIVAARSAGVRAELSPRLPHPWPPIFSVFHPPDCRRPGAGRCSMRLPPVAKTLFLYSCLPNSFFPWHRTRSNQMSHRETFDKSLDHSQFGKCSSRFRAPAILRHGEKTRPPAPATERPTLAKDGTRIKQEE